MDGRKWLLVAGGVVLALAAACSGGDTDSSGGNAEVVDASGRGKPDSLADGKAELAAPLDTNTGESPAEILETDAGADAGSNTVSDSDSDAGGSPAEILETDAGSDASSDSDTDGSCTRTGFEAVSAQAETSPAAEGGFLYLAAADSLAEPANVFGLELLLDHPVTGPYDFTDENYATCERCIRIDADCYNQGGCAKVFLVHAGRMDISAWDDPGGRFTVTFTELRAREVTISADLPLTSTPVEGGETWCIDALAFDVAPLEEM